MLKSFIFMTPHTQENSNYDTAKEPLNKIAVHVFAKKRSSACMSVLLQLNKRILNAQLAARGNVLWGMRFALFCSPRARLHETSVHKVTHHSRCSTERRVIPHDLGTLCYYPWYRAAAAGEIESGR